MQAPRKNWLPHAWQAGFLLLGATWLAAPFLNAPLSSRLAPLAQYELPVQPYSWLFRLGDVLAALLLLAAVYYLLRKSTLLPRGVLYVLSIIGLAMLLAALFTITCRQVGTHQCATQISAQFLVHAAAGLCAALLTFGLSLHDALKNRSSPSAWFVGFQFVYVALYLGGVDAVSRYATLAQIIYQAVALTWLAWFVGWCLAQSLDDEPQPGGIVARNLRRLFAVWAYVNGVLAILLAFRHIHLAGFLRNFYFAGNTAWLAQHGAIVGVAMFYVSRHIARGELRARQLFLVLLFMEIIKYSVVTPELALLLLYGVTFVLLFALRPFFRRGSVTPDWHLRLQEIALVLSGVAAVAGVLAFLISRNQRLYDIAHDTLGHLQGVNPSRHLHHHVAHGSLLAHTLTALAIATIAFLLWSLFRPAKVGRLRRSQEEYAEARSLLERVATNSEDFFKVWPQDKYYFWSADRQAFVAYTIVDSFVFALADPIAATAEAKQALLKDFVAHWHARAYTTCFLLLSEESLPLYQAVGLNSAQIGSSALIDIQEFVASIDKDKWWRWQRNRSSKAGYAYQRSEPPHDAELIRQCRQVSNAWLGRPGHRERGFALGVFTEAYLQQCVLHYLTDDSGQVIAFANQLPAFHDLPQTTVDMMRYLPDKNNAMPFLLSSALSALAEEGRFTRFDLGFVPLAKMDNVLVGIAKAIASRQVSASGLEQFKGKFKPTWRKEYLAYDGDLADLAVLALRIEDALKPRKG